MRLARQSIALDAEEPLAFDALASAYQFLNDVKKAEQAARRAIELFPACTAAYGTLIIVLAFQGRTEEALEFFAQSERTSPRDIDRSGRLMGLVFTHFVAKRYEDAISAAEQYVSLRPNWFGAHAMMAATLALMGRTAEASQAKDQVLAVDHRLARGDIVDRAAAQQLTVWHGLFLAGWLLGACCMIRIIIRVFQAMEARQPQRPWWEYPWWDGMNIIRRVQLRNTYWLEVIGFLIGFAAMLVAIGHPFLTPG